MSIWKRLTATSRAEGLRLQTVVEALDIAEYLDLCRDKRREIDALLESAEGKRLSPAALARLMRIFGEESATSTSLALRLLEGEDAAKLGLSHG